MRQQLPAAEQQALTDAQCRHWKQGRLRQMPRHRASLVLPPAAMLGQLQERCGPVTKPHGSRHSCCECKLLACACLPESTRALVSLARCAAQDAAQGQALVSRNADEQHAPSSAGWGSEGEGDDEDLMRAIAASLEAQGAQCSLPADFLSCKTTGYLRDNTCRANPARLQK